MKFINSQKVKTLLTVGLFCFIFSNLSMVMAQSEDCFPREEAAILLYKASISGDPNALEDVEKKIADACGVPTTPTTPTEPADELAIVQSVLTSNTPAQFIFNQTGSIFYEEISSCGYHAQRREGSCSVEVKQRYGFGGVPGVGNGSWEWMAFCIWGLPNNPNAWTLQNVSAVRVFNEPFGWLPSWYYTITDQAETRLHMTPVNGQTYVAKSILSWGLRPNSCNYTPVWGNEAYYRIRVDP